MAIRQRIIEGRNPLLELCPFCGEPGEIFCVKGEDGCRVRCGNKDCAFRPESRRPFPTEDLAVKEWNTHKGGLNCPGRQRNDKDSSYDDGFLM